MHDRCRIAADAVGEGVLPLVANGIAPSSIRTASLRPSRARALRGAEEIPGVLLDGRMPDAAAHESDQAVSDASVVVRQSLTDARSVSTNEVRAGLLSSIETVRLNSRHPTNPSTSFSYISRSVVGRHPRIAEHVEAALIDNRLQRGGEFLLLIAHGRVHIVWRIRCRNSVDRHPPAAVL